MEQEIKLPPPYQKSASHNHLPPPVERKNKGLRGCLIAVGVFFLLGVVGVLFQDEEEQQTDQARQTALMNRGEDEGEMSHDHVWTIDDVPMAHLENAAEYVSDPEHYLSRDEKRIADEYLARLETECNVQSAFIVVGHVKNADTYRFAVDLGRKYGIGTADTERGVTVVVAVEDRKWSIVTTMAVESELPDILANDIGTNYIVANMKKNNPPAAVMQSAEALFNLFDTGSVFIGETKGWTVKSLNLDSLLEAGQYMLDMDGQLNSHMRDSLNGILAHYNQKTGGQGICLLLEDMAGEPRTMTASISAHLKIDSVKVPSFVMVVKYRQPSSKHWIIVYNNSFEDKVKKPLINAVMNEQLDKNLEKGQLDRGLTLAIDGLTEKAETNRITAFAEPTSFPEEDNDEQEQDDSEWYYDLIMIAILIVFIAIVIKLGGGSGGGGSYSSRSYRSSSSSRRSSRGGSYGGGGNYRGGGASGSW